MRLEKAVCFAQRCCKVYELLQQLPSLAREGACDQQTSRAILTVKSVQIERKRSAIDENRKAQVVGEKARSSTLNRLQYSAKETQRDKRGKEKGKEKV